MGRARVAGAVVGCVLMTALGVPTASAGNTAPTVRASTAPTVDLDPLPERPSGYSVYEWEQLVRALGEIERLQDWILTLEDVGVGYDQLRQRGPLGDRFKPGVYDPDWPDPPYLRHWQVPKNQAPKGFTPIEMLMALREAARYGRMVVKLPEDSSLDAKQLDAIVREDARHPGLEAEFKSLGAARLRPTNTGDSIDPVIKSIQKNISRAAEKVEGEAPGEQAVLLLIDAETARTGDRPIPTEAVERAVKGRGKLYQGAGDRRADARIEAQIAEKTANGEPQKVVWDQEEGSLSIEQGTNECEPGPSPPQRQTSPGSATGLSSTPEVGYASTSSSGARRVAVALPRCGPAKKRPGGPALGGLAPQGMTRSLTEAQRLGGIDFSTMELRYLSVAPSDDGAQVSSGFRAQDTAGASNGTVADGLRGAVQASDAFFVWLALPKDRFWVNLNPDEPNRIMDPAFGRTDAGRVLLQSDFLLKKVDYKLMNPRTPLGDRYWRQLRPGPDGAYCLTTRVWIVPGTAKVRETEDSIYIVDAPLDVRMRPDDIQAAGCGAQPEATQRHNAAVYRRLILPRVKQTVNNAPEFEPLRRVYLSRVAAEWYRQQSESVPSAYSELIDSGNIDRWRLEGSWRPRQTFREYAREFRQGGYEYTERVVRGNRVYRYTYSLGGVDFTSLFKQSLSADAFESLAPGLTETVAKGLEQPAVDPRTKDRWLGATTQVEAADLPDAAAPVADSEAAATSTPGDPWSRESAPYVVPAMVLVGVGFVGFAVLRERRRQHGMRGWR